MKSHRSPSATSQNFSFVPIGSSDHPSSKARSMVVDSHFGCIRSR
ncbi:MULTISPECIES: hypothetical protein [unclassified Rathayibacter]|nr:MULTISPECIES: hypothetical protein [unclassified Rathayibacter]